MCDRIEGRLQRNPKWFGLRVDFAEMCDMIEGRHQGKPEVVGLRGEQGLQIEYYYSVCPKRFVDF